MTGEQIVEKARGYIGQPYVWGGESKTEGGFDCSGLLYSVLRDCNYKTSRKTAAGYSEMGSPVAIGSQKPGDFLFFGNPVTHCAIYIGNGQMIESRGGKINTKSNPGVGVVVSKQSRRSDLTCIRRFWDYVPTSSLDYSFGKNYSVCVDHLCVRSGPYGLKKKYSELSADAQRHAFSDGCLKKGTTVTCKNNKVETDGSTWIQIPSGWICAISKNGEVYVK